MFSEWQGQDGQKRNKIRVVADNIQFLDSADRNTGGGQTYMNDGPPPSEPSSQDSFPSPAQDDGETEAPF